MGMLLDGLVGNGLVNHIRVIGLNLSVLSSGLGHVLCAFSGSWVLLKKQNHNSIEVGGQNSQRV